MGRVAMGMLALVMWMTVMVWREKEREQGDAHTIPKRKNTALREVCRPGKRKGARKKATAKTNERDKSGERASTSLPVQLRPVQVLLPDKEEGKGEGGNDCLHCLHHR